MRYWKIDKRAPIFSSTKNKSAISIDSFKYLRNSCSNRKKNGNQKKKEAVVKPLELSRGMHSYV